MKISSGIEGFDKLSQGGFSIGGMNLISGVAGSGKTFFVLHFLSEGLKANEDVLLVTLEEEKESIERLMVDMDIDITSEKMHTIDLGVLRAEKIEAGEGMIGFRELKEFLRSFLTTHPVKRVVIDSMTAIGIYYGEIEKLRGEMFSFVRFLKSQNVTTLLTSEALEGGSLTRFGVEQFLADSFVVLGLEDIQGELRRTITIRKMRFSNHDTAKRPFHITKKGVEIFVNEKVI
jgi:circadian clock protein KaiC